MDRNQAKDFIKSQLKSYLETNNISTRKPFRCLNPEHTDNNPSMSYDEKRDKVHCFSCGVDYDTFDLIAVEYNLTEPVEIFNKAYEIYQIKLDTQDTQHTQEKEINAYMLTCHARATETDYFKKRGISEKLVKSFLLGYDPNFLKAGGQPWKAIIIPTGKGSLTARNIEKADNKSRYRKIGSNLIFNNPALFKGEPCFITEGELDALSVLELGYQAVAIGSTANYTKLIEALKQKPAPAPLILCLDNDERGQKTAEQIARNLKALNIPFLKANIAGEYKDPNEALINDRQAFKSRLNEALELLKAEAEEVKQNALEEYLKNNTANYIEEFINGISDSVNTPFLPTSFKNLDQILDGGLYEGLYIIGAISSLGKTSLILQIADKIAQEEQDILIFSLEMARSELMAKSISRLSFEISKDPRNAKTTRGITTGKRYAEYNQQEKDLIKNAILRYKEYAKNIYITEGIGDIGAVHIKDTVQKHITLTGKKPLVIVDYLQLLAPYDPRSTDKQNTDKAVLELKRISRDHKLPVIAISSFNRQSYKEAVTMEAFKESGAIEYSSDVLLGMQAKGAGDKNFNVDEAKQKDPREIELKILKNRNGKTGLTINLEYYPLFNYFREV